MCVCVCVCVCAECGGVPGEWVVTDVIPASQLGQPREKKHTLPKHVQLTLGRCSTSYLRKCALIRIFVYSNVH